MNVPISETTSANIKLRKIGTRRGCNKLNEPRGRASFPEGSVNWLRPLRCLYRLNQRRRTTFPTLPFQCSAIPLREVCSCFVGAPAKIEQRGSGRFGFAHVFIHQQTLAGLLFIIGGAGPDIRLFESRRLGSHVGIKSRAFDVATTRPETNAAYFMGICFSRDRIRARPLGSATAGKTRNCKIEASPEEV